MRKLIKIIIKTLPKAVKLPGAEAMQISENQMMSPFCACVLQQSAATLAGNRGLSEPASHPSLRNLPWPAVPKIYGRRMAPCGVSTSVLFNVVTTPRLVFRLPQWWLCPPACRSASLYLFFCIQHVRRWCGFWQREPLLGVLLLARWRPPWLLAAQAHSAFCCPPARTHAS